MNLGSKFENLAPPHDLSIYFLDQKNFNQKNLKMKNVIEYSAMVDMSTMSQH